MSCPQKPGAAQPLPRFLRSYGGSKAAKFARALYTNAVCFVANPLAYVKEVGGYAWSKLSAKKAHAARQG